MAQRIGIYLGLMLLGLLAVTSAVGCGTTTQSTNTQTTNTQSTSEQSSNTASTSAQLIASADPICAAVNAKRLAAGKALGKATTLNSPRTLRVLAQTARGVAKVEYEGVARMRTLKAPPSLSADWQTMLTYYQQLASNTERLGHYASEKKVAASEHLIVGSHQLRERLLVIARRDHFAHCGRNS